MSISQKDGFLDSEDKAFFESSKAKEVKKIKTSTKQN